MRFALLLGPVVATALVIVACTADTVASPSPDAEDGGTSSSSSGGSSEAGGEESKDAAPDSSAKTIRCTQAEFDAPCDQNGGACTGPQNTQIDISFPTTSSPAQYVNHCVKVKIGTDIDFAGDFTMHPLVPAGGDTPTPIPDLSINPPNGTSGMPEKIIKMTTAGTYGFECGFHPELMFGAIQVVP